VQARSQQPGRLSELAYYASGITSVAALSRVVQFSVRFFTYSKPFGSYPDTRSAQASFDPLAFGFQEIWGRRWGLGLYPCAGPTPTTGMSKQIGKWAPADLRQ
jgi:hypothetical protein